MAKLSLPQEIDIWYILPAIRREFAVEMIKQGLAQKDIAKMLGITEAAVSNYKKEKRASALQLSKKVKEEIQKSVKKIKHGKSDAFKETIHIDHLLKSDGTLCSVHKLKCSSLTCCSECKKKFLTK